MMNQTDIARIANDHRLFLETGGAQGARADFSGQDLRWADFRESPCLREADFTRSNCHWAIFDGVDLRRADFHGAKIYRATFYRALVQDSSLPLTLSPWIREQAESNASPEDIASLQAKTQQVIPPVWGPDMLPMGKGRIVAGEKDQS